MAILTRELIEEYALEIISRAQTIQKQCDILLSKDFSSDSPIKLAQTLKNICEYLINAISVICNSIKWSKTDTLNKNLQILQVIGSTLEYISVPAKLMCYVVGKSSWGRMGLIIATATKVDPGFKGCITLEIINEGEIPVVVYPGIPIAQLVFHETTREGKYDGKYNCPTGPQFPKFTSDKNYDKLKFWFPDKENKSTNN